MLHFNFLFLLGQSEGQRFEGRDNARADHNHTPAQPPRLEFNGPDRPRWNGQGQGHRKLDEGHRDLGSKVSWRLQEHSIAAHQDRKVDGHSDAHQFK